MAILPALLIFFIISALVTVLFIQVLRKGTSGIKIMILGINITLFGGILVVDPNTNLYVIEYIVIIIGLVFSLIGFCKKE